ncbi:MULTISPECIES: aminoacyl-histidine dipeptidase [Rhizobium/Agrobacterium group]|uniref:aminoacyl-histidine dipeptidase n=1 Tax=Rhizobium/Agrobacterium group TaxID=227290 RepID=UPI00107F0B1B|nr:MULTISPECIES: aminoacyl-histidine dipeptidase [Rhizobium/Agrobacterium group]MBB4402773.1 dipeptidase D [Agrobacterium radiobacter]MBB5589316.1 dipeptidase D [Agrobacterium radiobacter]TGE85861.1 aminoacyl-histidine dipeptidase [Rhizobium sp. SEMIA 4032]
MSVPAGKTVDRRANSVLAGLEPAIFFGFFEELSAIPRGSYNEKQVSDHIANFARSRGFEVYQDEIFNVLIKKPGTPGYENAPTLILHGHTDIVCESDEGVEHDFKNEGIKLQVIGDFIHGTGTTLGADNTVGVAFAMSLLASDDIAHPPLEVVLTVQEEVGKGGAQHFAGDKLSGKRLLDMNWHDPKSLFAGCAGDISARFKIPLKWEPRASGQTALSLRVSGLSSGHSEFDIHLERANAIVQLGRLLRIAIREAGASVAEVNGGVNRYVIPGEAEAIISVDASEVADLKQKIEAEGAAIAFEYKTSDPNLKVGLSETQTQFTEVFSAQAARAMVDAMNLLPNGVQSKSLQVEGLVESSNTVALLSNDRNEVEIVNTIPSAVSSRRYNIVDKIRQLSELIGNGAKVETFADCPEWPYNPDSRMLNAAKAAYEREFGEQPHVEVSHSSLELGLFRKKVPDIDMLSIGPEAFDVHTTRERLNHTTVDSTWRLLKSLLSELRT